VLRLAVTAPLARRGPCCLRRAGGCAGPGAPFARRAAAPHTAAAPAATVGYGPRRCVRPQCHAPRGPAQPWPSRSRAGYAWPLVGEGREGAAPPPRPAFAALVKPRRSRLAAPCLAPLVGEGREGERPWRRARPPRRTAAPCSAARRCVQPRSPAAASRAGPTAPPDASATGEEGGKRIREGSREGTRTAG